MASCQKSPRSTRHSPACEPQAGRAPGEWPFAHDGITAAVPVEPAVPVGRLATVAEPVRNPVPLLRLRTGDYV